MSPMSDVPLFRGPESHLVRDELLVATPYFDMVAAKLAAWYVGIHPVERSTLLGLSRIPLQAMEETLPELRDESTKGRHLLIQAVLQKLRSEFADDHQGWYPTMGKNRVVQDNVLGGGSTSYGGDGEPIAIDPLGRRDLLPSWPKRPATPGSGVRVAVVDTKMTAAQPLDGGWYATTEDTLAQASSPRDGHATFVAGRILREAPGAMIDVRAVLNNEGRATSWDAAKAIVEHGRNGAHILNLSFSCITGDGQPPLALATALDLLDTDVVVVAAAGNHGRNNPPVTAEIDGQHIDDLSRCVAYPAALDTVIAVGSMITADRRAEYSPAGIWVDVTAQGHDVISTFPTFGDFHGFASWSGTSFAAAQVSGAIAAQTVPGRVSARQAWDEIYGTLKKRQQADGITGGEPPYLAPIDWWR